MCPVNQGLVELPDTACCLRCGYALRGLPETRCPECGHPFDPLDPPTFRDPARRRRHGLGQLRPVYWRELVCVWSTALALAWLCTNLRWAVALPDFNAQVIIITGLGVGYAFAWGLWWYAIWRRRARPDLLSGFKQRRKRFHRLQWGIALYLFTLLYPWPVALRFLPQLPAFSAYAERYLTDRSTPTGPLQIGGERVAIIWGRGQGFVWFSFDESRCYGIARYSIPPSRANSGIRRPRAWIWPGWYVESWNPETW